ncbi:MAG: hypothetical protein U1U88_001688 [Lawsonella clevelandensis]
MTLGGINVGINPFGLQDLEAVYTKNAEPALVGDILEFGTIAAAQMMTGSPIINAITDPRPSPASPTRTCPPSTTSSPPSPPTTPTSRRLCREPPSPTSPSKMAAARTTRITSPCPTTSACGPWCSMRWQGRRSWRFRAWSPSRPCGPSTLTSTGTTSHGG